MIADVPYLSQLSQTARYATNDCGAAVLGMLHNWRYPKTPMTVDEVARVAGLAGSEPGLRVNQFGHVGAMIGLDFYRKAYQTLDDLKREIAANRPVICLVRLSALWHVYKRIKIGHYILIIGVTAERVTYLDPFWPEWSQEGNGAWCDPKTFLNAWTAHPDTSDFQLSRQAVYLG